ncbi:hypothetical protein [Brachybacterium sacelli]
MRKGVASVIDIRNLAGAGLRPLGAPSLLPRERGNAPAVPIPS